jgi:DNA-binding CsgD family transcriptional regulator
MNREHRLSDADRAAAVARLAEHRAAGRLTDAEVHDRTGAVHAARTRADLDAVFGDLPDDWSLRRAWRDRRWRAHAGAFVGVTAATIGLWLVVRDPDPLPRDYGVDYWWPLWLGLVWATAVLLHLLSVAGLFGPSGAARAVPKSAGADQAVPESAGADPAGPAQTARPAEASARAVVDRLTAREREVLTLVGQGRANKDIAREMFISERTARTHVSNILRKLELSSRTQAAILANRAGLGDR